MKIDEFTLYFLARLTKVQRVIDLNNRNNVIIDIPVNYKEIIEDILNSNESWKEEFSVLIDIDEYFKDHYYIPHSHLHFSIKDKYCQITCQYSNFKII